MCLELERGIKLYIDFPKIFRFKFVRHQQVGKHLKLYIYLCVLLLPAIMLQCVRSLDIISFFFTYAIISLEQHRQIPSKKIMNTNVNLFLKYVQIPLFSYYRILSSYWS